MTPPTLPPHHTADVSGEASPLSGAATPDAARIARAAEEGESLAAKVEALRVFLEETLGEDRFYKAYR